MPTPTVSVSLPSVLTDGQPNSVLSSSLLALRIEEDWLSGRHGVIEVANWTLDRAGKPSYPAIAKTHRIGTPIEVLFGDATVFSGRIVGHEARYLPGKPPTAAFLVADNLALMQRDVRYRVFKDTSIADVASVAANELGMMVETLGDTPMVTRLEQRGQSTWELLATELERFGLYWRLDDDTIHLAKRTEPSPDPTELELGNSLTRFEVRADATMIPTQARSAHWNARNGERTAIDVSRTRLQMPTDDAKNGAEVARMALGAMPLAVDNAHANSLVNARRSTLAALQQAVNQFVVADAETTSRPRLRVGGHVEIRGVDDWFSGNYYVAGVTHAFDQQEGARTELVLERPSIGYATARRVRPVRTIDRPPLITPADHLRPSRRSTTGRSRRRRS